MSNVYEQKRKARQEIDDIFRQAKHVEKEILEHQVLLKFSVPDKFPMQVMHIVASVYDFKDRGSFFEKEVEK